MSTFSMDGGDLYMSTFSMDGGDLFNPTVDILHPEFSIKIFKIFTSVELCGTL